MSTHQLKAGDKVTSPLLVGEWTVSTVDRNDGNRVTLKAGSVAVFIDPIDLTLVPPLPPELPQGSVVFVDGRPYMHDCWGSWSSPIADVRIYEWADIADRATPAVPLADVVQALVEWSEQGRTGIPDGQFDRASERIERLFGWPT